MNIQKIDFPESQYLKEPTQKKQVVLHHTVSGDAAKNIVSWWASTAERVATHFIITRKGEIYQLFDTMYWGCHLGMSEIHFKRQKLPYKSLDRAAIGIELCSWGPLAAGADGKFYPVKFQNGKYVANMALPAVNHFYEYCGATPYRGHCYYERYTTAQLAALDELLQHLKKTIFINPLYKDDIWDVCPRALKGEEGIFSHTSYRYDKSDVHPQPELLTMLKKWKK
jgi:N-acetyl-anhydromuramyl-L-alanine amidase AmpD